LQKEVENINESAKQRTPMLEKVRIHPIGPPNLFVATLQFIKQINHEEVQGM